MGVPVRFAAPDPQRQGRGRVSFEADVVLMVIIRRMTNYTRPIFTAERFENFSKVITRFTGSTTAFGVALGVVIASMISTSQTV